VVKAVAFAVPGDLATPTGGYAYDRRIIRELREMDWEVRVIDLGDRFPYPHAADVNAARGMLLEAEAELVVVDGLALGVLPDIAEEAAARKRLVGLVHHPLAYESGLPGETVQRSKESEKRALAAVRHVIVTSNSTAALLRDEYDVEGSRLTVAVPGTNRPDALARTNNGEVNLLAVGSLVHRKGYDVLLAALAPLIDLSWRLTVVGDCSRDPETTARVRAHVDRFALGDRVAITGALPEDDLQSQYARADVFVLASRYEGYGMAISEAVAHGLPVISTRVGAIPDTLPRGAGVLVPADDIGALSQAIRRVVADPGERARLAAGARAAAAQLPTWRQSAEIFADVLGAL
jgi:glycosyltransferase involved in cell wall biosynthesis